MKFSTIKSIFMQTQFNKLTDAQWLIISKFLPMNRKRKHDLRAILDAILYINRTGIQWRNLNVEGSLFPYWEIVYYYFRTWTKLGIIRNINFELVQLERLRQERSINPTANLVDSQSIKIAPFITDDKGIDGAKRINGRKRHIITDTLGLIIGVMVTAANIHDGAAGSALFNFIIKKLKNTKCIFADGTYSGKFRTTIEKEGIILEIAAKPESAKGFVPVKKRWAVERTFGWLNFFRRLSKDFERTVECSESMIYLAQIQIILNRLINKQN
jgi:putative transposase